MRQNIFFRSFNDFNFKFLQCPHLMTFFQNIFIASEILWHKKSLPMLRLIKKFNLHVYWLGLCDIITYTATTQQQLQNANYKSKHNNVYDKESHHEHKNRVFISYSMVYSVLINVVDFQRTMPHFRRTVLYCVLFSHNIFVWYVFVERLI